MMAFHILHHQFSMTFLSCLSLVLINITAGMHSLTIQIEDNSCNSSLQNSGPPAKLLVLPMDCPDLEANETHRDLAEEDKSKPPKETCKLTTNGIPQPCPIQWVEDIQENRIPRVIMMAKCSCENFTSAMLYCTEVEYAMPVWRKSNSGYFMTTYEQSWEFVTVSCSYQPRQIAKVKGSRIPHEPLLNSQPKVFCNTTRGNMVAIVILIFQLTIR